MGGILIFAVVIVGIISLFIFRNSFIETHNRSCMHLPHVIIMLLYVLSMGMTSNMTSFFGILCWLALAAIFVYYVKQYGLLAAIGVWLYNTLMFVLVVGAILQLIGSRKNTESNRYRAVFQRILTSPCIYHNPPPEWLSKKS